MKLLRSAFLCAVIFGGCSKNDTKPEPLLISSVTANSAAVGDTLTIGGTSFSANPSDNIVSFNSTHVTVVKASASFLSVLLPAGFSSGVISVSVTVNGVTATYAYNYTKLPAVTTLAGSSQAGFIEGTGTAASFQNPAGIVLDGSGNLYVCDQSNHRIRKVTASGVVTTYAGNGVRTYADGAAANASFSAPGDIAIDRSGNLYIADPLNFRIRKIAPGGLVSTFSGSGTLGIQDGPANTAQFGTPRGMVLDAAGNLYVADVLLCKIRKIAPDGSVTTLAGSGTKGAIDGTGITAQFMSPGGLTIDAGGNLYVTDADANKIRRITPAGVVTTFAGSGTAGNTDGTGTAAQFFAPDAITADAQGSLYVSDAGNHRIRKITSAGVVTTVAGSKQGFANGNTTTALFNYPAGLAVDASGVLYIADFGNQRIRVITP